MRKRISIILIIVYIVMITFFLTFGEKLRDYYSPHIEVMSPIMYTFPDGYISMVVLSNDCFFINEDGEITAFIIEEKTETGEQAYYAKKISVILGKSDDKCSEVIKAPTIEAMFICSSDGNISDGDRVVIERIIDIP